MKRKTLSNNPTKIVRTIIYPMIAVIFIVALGALLVLANGYLPTIKDGKVVLQKTGMIIIAARPLDANITVNGKYKEKTSFYMLQNKINNLLPGRYNLRIDKKGYRTWEKNMDVEPGIVSWANYAILFAEKLDIKNLADPNGTLLTSSINHDNLLFTNSKNGVFTATSVGASGAVSKSYWPKNTTSLPDWLKTPQVVKASYSQNSDKVLFTIKNAEVNQFVIVEPNGNDMKTVVMNDLLKVNVDDITWDPYDNNSFFIRYQGKLYHQNQSSATLGTPLAVGVVNFSPEANKQIYYASKSESGITSIIKSGFDGSNKSVLLDTITPSVAGYKLLHTGFTDTLAILNKDNGELLLLTPASGDSGTILRLGKGYRDISWQKNGQKLLYFNDKIINRYDLEKKKITTLNYSGDISSVHWYFDECHYLVNGSNGLEIVEYDGDNSVSLSFVPSKAVYMDNNSNNLIYSLTEGETIKYFSFSSPY